MTVALVCVALLGLLVFVLGLAVSLTRARTDIVAGYPDDPAARLHKLVRAHANTTEYSAMLALLFLVLGSRDPATWVVWSMEAATASRYLLVAGILLSPTLAKAHPLRFLGALGTYVFGSLLCLALLMSL